MSIEKIHLLKINFIASAGIFILDFVASAHQKKNIS